MYIDNDIICYPYSRTSVIFVNKYCTGNPSVLFHRTVELGGISLGSIREGSGGVPRTPRPLYILL